MRHLIIFATLALAACQTTPEPAIKIVTQEVPTPVPCVDEANIPPEPPQVGDRLTGNAQHDLGIIAPTALELRRWGRELRALIVPGCTIVETSPE